MNNTCISDEERTEWNKRLIAEQTNAMGEQRKEYEMMWARMSVQSSREEAVALGEK